MQVTSDQPIGIFDSGVGGLTVAHAVAELLPYENIIYFGDTAHLPYGDKSAETIQSYCKEAVDRLLSKSCKVILVACNTATAAAYEMLKTYLNDKAYLLGVVDPVVEYVAENFADKRVGLIGTRQTVGSQIFHNKLSGCHKNIELQSLATPLLAPMIEEGFYLNENIADAVLQAYLTNEKLQNIEALILACTHYPLLKARIQHFYNHRVELIDAPQITAKKLFNFLQTKTLLNDQRVPGECHFYFSDYTDNFSSLARYFFGEQILLEIWQ